MPKHPKTRYPVSEEMRKRIENTYTHHPPFGDQQERYEVIRAKAKELALVIVECTPPSREQSIALTELESVIYNANAAIARNEQETPPTS